MADDERLLLALEDTASTGFRVVGLRTLNYTIAFVASVIVARAIGPQGRGLVALPIAFLGIVMALTHVGIEHSNVYLAARGESLRRLWAASALIAVIASFAGWAVVAVATIVGPGFLGGLPASWVAIAVAQLPLLLMSLYWAGLLQLDGGLTTAVRATLAGTSTHAAAIGVLWVTGGLTPFRVLALTWVSVGVTWALLLRGGIRRSVAGSKIEPGHLRRAISFGLRAQFATLFTFLLLRVDQLMVQGALGFEALGLYTLAVVLSELLWLATDPFAASMLPHQVRADPGDGRRLGFATARLALVVALVAGVIAWFAAPYAIRLAYGPAFEGAVWPFRLLLPGVVALALQRPLGPILLTEGRVALVALMNASALVVNIALNLALLPTAGVVGASVASSATYAGLAVAYVFAVRRPGVSGFRDLVPRHTDLARLRSAWRRRPAERMPRRPGPLRAVLVIGTLDRGGTEGQVVLLARGLLARGWEVTVLCLAGAGAHADDIRAAGGEVVVGGFRGLTPLLNPLPLIRVFRRIREAVRARDPDVVHAFLYWGALIGVWAGHTARVPVVVASQRSLRSASGAKAILRPWERRAIRWADAWLCNSEAVRHDAVSYGAPAAKARVIANGIDAGPEPSSPSVAGLPRVLVVANLIPYKGHRTALDAFAMVLDRDGHDAAELRFAGSGPEEEALRRQAGRLGLADRVHFLGSITNVSDELQACRCTVLPSMSEGLPNAVLESMAAGRAVVATSVGGAPEALAEGGGVLVPPGDAEALAEQIGRLVADSRLAEALGEQGRRAVVRRFGVDRMIEETIALYEELGERASGSLSETGRTRTGSSRS